MDIESQEIEEPMIERYNELWCEKHPLCCLSLWIIAMIFMALIFSEIQK